MQRADVRSLHEMEKAGVRLPSAILRLKQLVKNKNSAAQRCGKARQAPGGADDKVNGKTATPATPAAAAAAEPSISMQPLQLGKRAASKDAEETAEKVMRDELQDLLSKVLMSPLTL
jgi:hypothetical protein